jgi:hypothetical protein
VFDLILLNERKNKLFSSCAHVFIIKMKKIGKTQEKKFPSLIFDIFRDGKVSFDIKNNNLFLRLSQTFILTFSCFEYF